MKKNNISGSIIFLILLFLIYTIWRLILWKFYNGNEFLMHYWGGSYQVIAIIGGVYGIKIARDWGGFSSLTGRILGFFSIGLFAQSFGQTIYTYYVITVGEATYPSLGDLGYFSSVILYIYAAYLLAKLSYVKLSLTSYKNFGIFLSVLIGLLTTSYFVFLRGYAIDPKTPLTVFLDFGYPFGQAIYVSIALVTLIFSTKTLGGIMKMPTLILLVALTMQYISDYSFLYLSSRGLWVGGGINDYMYLTSYFLMGIALINMGRVLGVIRTAKI